MIKEVMGFIFLGINALSDGIRKQIFLWSIPLFFGLGTICCWMKQETVCAAVVSLLPGGILLLLGRVTRGGIGYGDGLVVLVMGLYLGLGKTCELVLGGLFLSALWGGALMVIQKKGKHQEFPWIPCLLLAYLGGQVIGWIT